MKKEIGLYIHIPFCKSKCHYCDFKSYVGKEERIPEYIKALKKEIQAQNLENYKIKTIYIGGGTPSILREKDLKEILTEVTKSQTPKEITLELNPGTATTKKLQAYKNLGITRLSIGLQSTQNNLLKQLGRIHTYEQFEETYKQARKVGLNNINIDLILGIPNQAQKDLKESLEKIISLNPEHISVYSLIIEEGTQLANQIAKCELKMPEDETERKMYWQTKKTLEAHGYIHYEISNFAKKGYESKHNLDCWNQKEYIGIGAAAHSYINKTRYSNKDSIEEYIKDNHIIVHENQTKEDQKREYMMLGLRKLEGINIQNYKNKFRQNPIYEYRKELSKLVEIGLIEITGNHIKLTPKGLDLANIVWEEFIWKH